MPPRRRPAADPPTGSDDASPGTPEREVPQGTATQATQGRATFNALTEEEITELLELRRQLRERRATPAPPPESNDDARSMLSSRLDDEDDLSDHKFKSHTVPLYKAESEQEFQQWVDTIEADHAYYRGKAFKRDEDKVHHATRTLDPKGKAREYLDIHKAELNPRICPWEDFKRHMLDAAGSKDVRDEINYQKRLKVAWKGTAQSTLREVKMIEQLMSYPYHERDKLLHFRNLTPNHLLKSLGGVNVPQTRQELVTALDVLVAQSSTIKTAEQQLGAGGTEASKNKPKADQSGEKGGGQGQKNKKRKRGGGYKTEQTAAEKAASDKQREKDAANSACFHCHKPGHSFSECRSRPKNKVALTKAFEAGKKAAQKAADDKPAENGSAL